MFARQLVAGVLTIGSAVVPAAGTADNIQQAAEDICSCFGDNGSMSNELIEALKNAQATGDMSVLMQYQGEMMGVVSAFEKCFEGLPAKYPDINSNPELQNQVMALVDQHCPNPASFMMGQ